MDCTSTGIDFRTTGVFSKIALDYLDGAPQLRPFYTHTPDLAGVKQSIAARRQFSTDRELLVSVLREQYKDVQTEDCVSANIESLLSADTFTITTAHQNNIFTGPLYFIYKILHVIRLAAELNENINDSRFVPVYYMGSEDADLEELNHIRLNGNEIVWNTTQTGAVGRMLVDKELLRLMDVINGELGVLPFGADLLTLIRDSYREGTSLQLATFRFVHALLGRYGVIVLIPDNAMLKRTMLPVFRDDLWNQAASGIVGKSAGELARSYKVQAHPREINLFYLDKDRRDRIERPDDHWEVLNGSVQFTESELMEELDTHPERFSPNVILRGLYQETILPNIIFTGGGGELAYWLELRALFQHYQVPYPLLMLRNSFMLLQSRDINRLDKLGFNSTDLFRQVNDLVSALVRRDSGKKLALQEQAGRLSALYQEVGVLAADIDPTLAGHVDALRAKALHRLTQVEKKMLRAERRNFTDQERQIRKLKDQLFPSGGLQERTESVLPFYATWGPAFIDQLYAHSPGLQQQFTILAFSEDMDKAVTSQ